MVNKKNVSSVRRLNLEYGGRQFLGTLGFLGKRRGEWARRQIRKIRFTARK